MRIVIDTNIIFSLLLNTKNTIGDIFFDSKNQFEFFSCSYMRIEISKHWEKLKKISGLSDNDLNISYLRILSKIRFINEELIPEIMWLESEKLVKDIDYQDIDFVALSIYLNASLWTGDKVLYNGLQKAKFKNALNTTDLKIIKG